MNRIKEINKFLKYYAKIYNQNPNLEITSDTIYDGLKNYGYKEKEIKDVRYLFKNFLEKYANSKTLNVHTYEKQQHFLRFFSKGRERQSKYFKLYISCNEKNLYECACKIFDFIDQNNIETASKIADTIRADDIVLRIYSEEDAIKVINFINNDHKLKKSAKPTNPFLTRQGVVGMAYDDEVSYNSIVSDLVAEYFKKCRNDNTLKDVSVEGLIYFIKSYHLQNFKNTNGITNFKNSKVYSKFSKYHNSFGGFMTNINDYITTIRDFRNITRESELTNFYNQVDIYSKDNYNLFIEALEATIKKYKLDETQLAGIVYNCTQNKFENITNDNNYRNLMMNLIKPNDIITFCAKYLSEMRTSFETNNIESTFANTLCRQIELEKTEDLTPVVEQIQNNNFNDKYNLFIEAIQTTIAKYDYTPENISDIIRKCLNGNYESITNDNNYREQIEKTFTPADIEVICKNHMELSGYDLTKIDDLATYFAYVICDQVNKLNKGQNIEGQK